ncbi:MAG: undecaprenyl/decaprenyl-phosphate alpha-N-acetylglucosaminyl 1-phosphate transferase, partial [Muribaculaceae bacterium]|nr:undecaprenyl/decaprenyl-phosphate alpha-N-acetylglucosaminyl 1-phosphate transferase [Muribaculaceae bacterium]
MNYWIANYFITIITATLIAIFIIPKILLIAFRCNLYDTIDDRKIHSGIVPRLGGLSFLPALGVTLCLVVGVDMRYCPLPLTPEITVETVELLFLAAALLVIYLLGIADDLIGVRYRTKFLFQIISGTLLVVSGLWVKNLYGFLWIWETAPWFGALLAIFLTVYLLNAMNLIDGIDGLASGLSIVALAWYSFIFYHTGEYVSMLIAAATLGTLLPFFYFNVFGKASAQTKIFMGDTGSLTIGLILVYLSLKLTDAVPQDCMKNYNLFILAVAPIIIPCFDVVRVFLHRIRKGRNPFLPDKSHIHHKLLALGFGQSKALIVILISDALLILLNLWCSLY